jgi:hypothetical protein
VENKVENKVEAPKATTQQVVDDIVKEETDIEKQIKDDYAEMIKQLGAEMLTRDT